MALQMSKLKDDGALLQTVRDLRVALQPLAFIRDVCPLTFVLLDLIFSAPNYFRMYLANEDFRK
jgi:hypothetical protein